MPGAKPLTRLSRTLRSDPTDAEKRLWHHLRAHRLNGHKFKRQAPVGNHIADFLCDRARIVIEVDGGQHAESPADADRTAILQSQGYTVLRFWNHDVLHNIEGVLQDIRRALTLATGR
ncbi:endonuclease domain-containing protein [Sphingobium phenoxybenzoativorans]|uniref:Endonuclease domain-containing protein n=1 Tax=Sphingobium phenoxybenzoativorans TaxID=1592790 RepID=A0A975K7M0_9SPHN|nr:endonuclease domain-containing protein [Sphingobium phenoxybenzoativorans]QUT06286.1 endonuclease domain-containing protein [Sphingobium phenoxybenzoativorans]